MLKNIENLYIGGNSNGKWQHKDKESSKFNRIAKIQKIYPKIYSKLNNFSNIDRKIDERKACAFATLIIIECGIRIGNENSAKGYISKMKKTKDKIVQTYGLTTLLNEHVSFNSDDSMSLNFIGKKFIEQNIKITDKHLIEVGRQFKNQNFNRWITLSDDTEITDYMVNKFIKKSINSRFSAKDFRTFLANIEAASQSQKILLKQPKDFKKKTINKEIKKIIKKVSKVLGNTPGIAKKAYINPQVLYKHWDKRGFNVKIISKKGKKKELIKKITI